VSAVCLASIITAIIGIDTRVRERFWRVFSSASDGDMTPVVDQINAFGQAVWRIAEEHSIAQAPLLVFTAVAVLLVVFMLRT
jgi:hypothetical protein